MVSGSLRDRCAPRLENSGLEHSGENVLSPYSLLCPAPTWPHRIPYRPSMQVLVMVLFSRLAGGGQERQVICQGHTAQGPALLWCSAPSQTSLFSLCSWSHLPGVPKEEQVPRLTVPQLRMFPMCSLPRDHGLEEEGLVSSASWTPEELPTSCRCLSSLHCSFFIGKLELICTSTTIQDPP